MLGDVILAFGEWLVASLPEAAIGARYGFYDLVLVGGLTAGRGMDRQKMSEVLSMSRNALCNLNGSKTYFPSASNDQHGPKNQSERRQACAWIDFRSASSGRRVRNRLSGKLKGRR